MPYTVYTAYKFDNARRHSCSATYEKWNSDVNNIRTEKKPEISWIFWWKVSTIARQSTKCQTHHQWYKTSCTFQPHSQAELHLALKLIMGIHFYNFCTRISLESAIHWLCIMVSNSDNIHGHPFFCRIVCRYTKNILNFLYRKSVSLQLVNTMRQLMSHLVRYVWSVRWSTAYSVGLWRCK